MSTESAEVTVTENSAENTQKWDGPPDSPFIDPSKTRRVDFEWRGNEIWIEFYAPSWGIISRATEHATIAYQRQFGASSSDVGILPTVMMREIAIGCIRKWSLPKSPRNAWDDLHPDLARIIMEKTDLSSIISERAREEEVENAKK